MCNVSANPWQMVKCNHFTDIFRHGVNSTMDLQNQWGDRRKLIHEVTRRHYSGLERSKLDCTTQAGIWDRMPVLPVEHSPSIRSRHLLSYCFLGCVRDVITADTRHINYLAEIITNIQQIKEISYNNKNNTNNNNIQFNVLKLYNLLLYM